MAKKAQTTGQPKDAKVINIAPSGGEGGGKPPRETYKTRAERDAA